MSYEVPFSEGGLVKSWTKGVQFEPQALEQVKAIARLPFIHHHVAVMADVHMGIGATVGSVIPTRGAIIPAAVGVDIGCGMGAVRLPLKASDLPDNLARLRSEIEAVVPHGRTDNGVAGRDKGAWDEPPAPHCEAWTGLLAGYSLLVRKHPGAEHRGPERQIGTLGTGNHFIEVCLDEEQRVWVMLHSGSRGAGGRIGNYFINLAKEDMRKWFINLPEKDLAYLPEGTEHFDDYVAAVEWAQNYARVNRELMMTQVLRVFSDTFGTDLTSVIATAVNAHHNYIARENHFGANVWVTRKGAVRAREGDMGIIPGSMGTRSYIVRGKGNADSFTSCSHGAGRRMSRNEAKRTFTLADHEAATAGVECRKDADVIDETPGCYKDIDAVMAAQSDLVEVVHTLKQVLCVKG